MSDKDFTPWGEPVFKIAELLRPGDIIVQRGTDSNGSKVRLRLVDEVVLRPEAKKVVVVLSYLERSMTKAFTDGEYEIGKRVEVLP